MRRRNDQECAAARLGPWDAGASFGSASGCEEARLLEPTSTGDGTLGALNIMRLHSPASAVMSAVIFNALIIMALVPLALRGVRYRPAPATTLVRLNIALDHPGDTVGRKSVRCSKGCRCCRGAPSSIDGREVRVALPADLPLMSVDPVLLQQVLVNLLENATKYTPPGAPIEIGAEAAQATMGVHVADHGPGIPTGDEERIFEKFYRGPQAGAGGVGLGLAICRGIVEAHGGTIRAESRSGGGALFRIALPLVGEVPSLPPEAAAPPSTEEAAT